MGRFIGQKKARLILQSGIYNLLWPFYVRLGKPFTVHPIKWPKIGPWTTQERRNAHFM